MEQDLKQFHNKLIDIELLFIILIKLKRYDYNLYLILREKLIIELKQDKELIPIKDLELNYNTLKKFYDWYLYFNCFETIEIKF